MCIQTLLFLVALDKQLRTVQIVVEDKQLRTVQVVALHPP